LRSQPRYPQSGTSPFGVCGTALPLPTTDLRPATLRSPAKGTSSEFLARVQKVYARAGLYPPGTVGSSLRAQFFLEQLKLLVEFVHSFLKSFFARL
jgi:hypothetical protein